MNLHNVWWKEREHVQGGGGDNERTSRYFEV
jgi:hypothetical protein